MKIWRVELGIIVLTLVLVTGSGLWIGQGAPIGDLCAEGESAGECLRAWIDPVAAVFTVVAVWYAARQVVEANRQSDAASRASLVQMRNDLIEEQDEVRKLERTWPNSVVFEQSETPTLRFMAERTPEWHLEFITALSELDWRKLSQPWKELRARSTSPKEIFDHLSAVADNLMIVALIDAAHRAKERNGGKLQLGDLIVGNTFEDEIATLELAFDVHFKAGKALHRIHRAYQREIEAVSDALRTLDDDLLGPSRSKLQDARDRGRAAKRAERAAEVRRANEALARKDPTG